jgi:hypothetical protein
MTLPGLLLACSGAAAVVALVLSVWVRGVVLRRVALLSLWLALAAVPASVAWDLAGRPSGMGDEAQTPLRRGLAHAVRYGTLALPVAGLSLLAIKRAGSAGRRRPKRRE